MGVDVFQIVCAVVRGCKVGTLFYFEKMWNIIPFIILAYLFMDCNYIYSNVISLILIFWSMFEKYFVYLFHVFYFCKASCESGTF